MRFVNFPENVRIEQINRIHILIWKIFPDNFHTILRGEATHMCRDAFVYLFPFILQLKPMSAATSRS